MQKKRSWFRRALAGLVLMALPLSFLLCGIGACAAGAVPDAVEKALSESFGSENYAAEAADTGFAVRVWIDGLGAETELSRESGGPTAQWAAVKACALAIARLAQAAALPGDGQTPAFSLYVMDDRDRTSVLLAVDDGEITQDAFAAGADPAGQGGDAQEQPAAAPTMGEANALKSAQRYLAIMAFSYDGLVSQLEYEGYTHDEALYAVDNCGADWNEQAAKKAASYLNMMSFSRDGLIEQLQFEGFSEEQAVYGVTQNGY